MDERIEGILEVIKDMTLDNTIPRNVKIKLENVKEQFKTDKEISLIKDNVLSILEEISDDINLQAFTRTQIWNLISAVEIL
ncbi:MAG: UPF0147 family protein [Candidatus Nanoarchaeia archaeon]|nr:UPF0147 family protein [Candidatus Nanoarchaeia archaeon]